jgi:hypothetical protein
MKDICIAFVEWVGLKTPIIYEIRQSGNFQSKISSCEFLLL